MQFQLELQIFPNDWSTANGRLKVCWFEYNNWSRFFGAHACRNLDLDKPHVIEGAHETCVRIRTWPTCMRGSGHVLSGIRALARCDNPKYPQ